MQPRLFGALLFLATAQTLFHLYFYVRLVRDPAWPRRWRAGLTAGLVAAGLSLPASVVAGRMFDLPGRWGLVWPAYVWMGCTLILALLLLAADAARFTLAATNRLRGAWQPAGPSRRQFLARAIGISAAAGAFGISGLAVREALRPHVRRVRVVLRRLPAVLDGLVIAQITDLHVGETIRRGFVEGVVRQTNALNPDVIVLTGDIVDASVERLRDQAAPLGQLRARLGVFFVTGNHEYYAGAVEWTAHFATLGVRVLRNERVTLGAGEGVLDLAGIDDPGLGTMRLPEGYGPDLPKALAGIDPGREVVLLAHQPRLIAAAAKHNVGLVLSGHTHGGQIWPWGYLAALVQPYVRGLHLHEDKTWIYVSCGTGYLGPPMRIGAPPEIARIELRRTGQSGEGLVA